MEYILEKLQRKQPRKRFSLAVPWFDRRRKDTLARQSMGLLARASVLLVFVIAAVLLIRTWPILINYPLGELILSSTWHPLKGAFGFYPFIMGTLFVTGIAMLIAVPPSLLTAIYLAEYASNQTRGIAKPLIDLLAGIPSVVYGVWGVLTVVPFIGHTVTPLLNKWLGFIPLFSTENFTGYGLLAGGVVLAVMIFPIIIAVTDEVILAVPNGLREASLALGATRWQTIKSVILRKAWPGVIAAVVLGLSRAFGETMAVLMVVGNVAKVPESIFDPAYPLTALIANNYGEMMSIPLYDAALMGGALILLVIVFVFNIASRVVLVRAVRNAQ
jgi:phosphate transport system permease protein